MSGARLGPLVLAALALSSCTSLRRAVVSLIGNVVIVTVPIPDCSPGGEAWAVARTVPASVKSNELPSPRSNELRLTLRPSERRIFHSSVVRLALVLR